MGRLLRSLNALEFCVIIKKNLISPYLVLDSLLKGTKQTYYQIKVWN